MTLPNTTPDSTTRSALNKSTSTTKLSDQPIVADFMTAVPATIDAGLQVMDAYERMYIDNIRHLPVVDKDDYVVGILSSSDVAQVASIEGSNIDDQIVAERMTKSPYTCEATTPLAEVALEMEKRRLGSVVVTKGGKATGIFTTTDALVAVRSLIAGERLEAANPSEHLPSDEPATSPNAVHLRKPVSRDKKLNWGLFLSP